MYKFVHDIFNGVEIQAEAVEGLLVLVPEMTKPRSIKSFRLIVLCNVCVKLVNKVIANIVKTVFKEIITANQSSFVPGRQSMDNVIICQELIQSLRYTKARKEGMIKMLDMEKAYDRME